jgi:ABC-2 type transport system permease protein
MPADLAFRAPATAGRNPAAVVGGLAGRRAVRSGGLWGVIFGAWIALQEHAFVSLYPTLASRAHLAATLGSDAGTSILFGPAREQETVVFSILGAIWGLLLSTRLLRGEEDAGRWELLLAGQTTRGRAAAQVVIGQGAGLGALFAVTALFAVAIGQQAKIGLGVTPSLFFALACVAGAAMFLAVGTLTSQLAASRRQAAGYAAGLLGISFALRVVADSGGGLTWLRWLSPLGWVEELQPLTHPQPLALLPIVAFTALVTALAVRLAGARDLDASTIPDRAHATPRTRLLGGPTALTLRLTRGIVSAWAGAVAALSLILGLVAKSARADLSGPRSVTQFYARLGIHGGTASAYLGLAFLIVAALIAFAAVGQVAATRGEESAGRLESLLVRPVSRWSWLGGRLGIAAAALVGLGLLAGMTTWAAAASQGAPVPFASVLAGGLNTVPPALCLLGLGVFALGIWPRSTVFAAYGVLAWSFLIDVFGGSLNISHWILDTSVFHQMAAAPAVSPDWTSGAVMTGIGAVAAVAGGIAFSRRDLAGD